MGTGDRSIRTLIPAEAIAARVAELGAAITRDHADRSLVILCILKGSFIFTADLVRHIALPLRVEFLGLQSYGAGTRSTGVVQITQDLTQPIAGQDVIVVEDIVDTGLSLSYLLELLRPGARAAFAVALCSTSQRGRLSRRNRLPGFTVEDHFVEGYGLDWAQQFRDLPSIGALEPAPA
jgi:hypoxanthine phosphoribosyltransferase